ncbi:MAG: amino acid ABC transporter permease [Oscillospiraceae bacterium]|jgi:L-cystine transport system permease protein|nr:amino acid ABC transporter permease [Oscillospiraceae bacterium]
MDFAFLWTALQAAAARIPATLSLAFVPFAAGILVGLPTALVRRSSLPVLPNVLAGLVALIKGIPVVLMMLVFFVLASETFDGFMQSLGLPWTFRELDKSLVAGAALTVYATAAMCEVFRGALAAVPQSQYDAAYAAGLTGAQTLRRIILPQMVAPALPMTCNILVALVKSAAIASLVSVVDVMNGAVIAAAGNYRFLEAYIAAALVYWALCLLIENIFRLAEKKCARRFAV